MLFSSIHTTVLTLPFIAVMSVKSCEKIRRWLEEKAKEMIFSPPFSVIYRTAWVVLKPLWSQQNGTICKPKYNYCWKHTFLQNKKHLFVQSLAYHHLALFCISLMWLFKNIPHEAMIPSRTQDLNCVSRQLRVIWSRWTLKSSLGHKSCLSIFVPKSSLEIGDGCKMQTVVLTW